jgi:drug/metabolite transporter (DMT)-like permease
MSWWGYALLSASCWGTQYVLLEILFRRLPFAAAYSFLSLANGILVALVLFLIYPKQDWTQLWQEKRILGMMMLYLIFGSGGLQVSPVDNSSDESAGAVRYRQPPVLRGWFWVRVPVNPDSIFFVALRAHS